jgi:hypothetical protein
MRIERQGKIEPLTPRIERYLREGLKAKALDDVLSPQQTRPDYSCLKDMLVIELKTLEEDGSQRMENLNDELRGRPDYPAFYGEVPVESLLKNMNDADSIRKKLADRFGRAIVSHLRKAKDQLGAHARDNPGKRLVKLVLLVNEDHELYEPEMVQYTLLRALSKRENGELIYSNIDAVIYMSERHAMKIGDQIAFPILTVEGDGMIQNPWKELFIQRFLDGWSRWNRRPVIHRDQARASGFETIDHIPDSMARSDLWRLEYRRKPYMANFTDEQIRDRFDESTMISCLATVQGSPMQITKEAMTENMRFFTHLLMEINRRAIPMHKMRYSLERGLAAAERLKLPPAAREFIRRLETIKAKEPPTAA